MIGYAVFLETASRESGGVFIHRLVPKKSDPTTKKKLMYAMQKVMDDLRAANVDFLTIGQYLQPSPKHHAIDRFVTPDEFEEYKTMAYGKGFLLVSSSPLTRSSYHADVQAHEAEINNANT